MYEVKEQRLDAIVDSLNNSVKNTLNKAELRYQKTRMSYILQNPMSLVLDKRGTYELY